MWLKTEKKCRYSTQRDLPWLLLTATNFTNRLRRTDELENRSKQYHLIFGNFSSDVKRRGKNTFQVHSLMKILAFMKNVKQG